MKATKEGRREKSKRAVHEKSPKVGEGELCSLRHAPWFGLNPALSVAIG